MTASQNATAKHDKNEKSTEAQQTTKANQRGTEQSPLIVLTLPPRLSETQASIEAREKSAHEKREGMIAWGTVGLALVTAILARYTYLLWRATSKMARDTEASAKATAEKMQASVAEAARAATAMEGVAEAMSLSAKAAVETATITRRMLAAQYPPVLKLGSVVAEVGDNNSVTIRFHIENVGQTLASIKGTYMRDSVFRRTLEADAIRAVRDDPDLVGQEIPGGRLIQGSHTCEHIKLADLGSAAPVLPTINPVGVKPQVGPPPMPELGFEGFITFENEGGGFGMMQFQFKCQPPLREFIPAE